MPENPNNIIPTVDIGPYPDPEKDEPTLLSTNQQLPYKERFLQATRLYKIQKTIDKAIITHQPIITK